VLLWSMDVLLRTHEIVLNHAELVRVDSVNFGEKHPFFWSNFEKQHCLGKLSSNSIDPCHWCYCGAWTSC
jgi:hypothetical protein